MTSSRSTRKKFEPSTKKSKDKYTGKNEKIATIRHVEKGKFTGENNRDEDFNPR